MQIPRPILPCLSDLALAGAALALLLAADPAGAQGFAGGLGRISGGESGGTAPAAVPDLYGTADEAAFAALGEAPTEEALNDFIARYPESPLVSDAHAILYERAAEAIAALAQCDKRWPALAESCDVAALTDFSESCDGSTFHRRAVLRLRGVKLGMLCPATGTDTGTATASAPATEALEGPGPGAALPAPPAETPAETPAESPSAAEPAAAPPERRQADPDPAPEPEPAFDVRPASGPLYVTRASNVRLGPGTRYERVATLPAGRRIQMTGESPNGWKRFELDGRTVFIAGSLVRATPPAAAAPAADPAPARVTTARTQTPARQTQPEPAEEALRDGFRWESEGSATPAVSAADALRARQETEAAATPTPAATQASQTPAPAQTVASQAEPEPEETWTPFGANSGGGSGGGGGGGAN